MKSSVKSNNLSTNGISELRSFGSEVNRGFTNADASFLLQQTLSKDSFLGRLICIFDVSTAAVGCLETFSLKDSLSPPYPPSPFPPLYKSAPP